jgi:hypothetical protein
MKKIAIFMLLLFSLESIAQTVYERQLKYWYLRDRLRHFIVPSDDPLNDKGTFMVITSRNRNWTANDSFTEIADYGQENRLFGKYIGVLATEYYLLNYYGNSAEAQRTNNELISALNAYKRLDLCEEQIDHTLQNTYDGFFIRHDVPVDDVIGPPRTNSFILQSELNTDAGLLIDSDPLIDEYDSFRLVTHLTPSPPEDPFTPFNENMSKDEAIFLLEGLALAYKFGSNEAQGIARQHAYLILNRLFGYVYPNLHWHDWIIYDPYGNIIPGGEGGIGLGFSYGFTKIATDFFGFSELEFYCPSLAHQAWEACFPGGILQNADAHMLASIAAIGEGWGDIFHRTHYGIYNNTDQEGWDYYYLWLYKALWNESWSLYNVDRIEDRLDEAPCEGPWLKSADEHALNGWASPERWSHKLEEQNGDPPGNVGIYSGIDYLLLFNLYFINNVLGSAPYENYANAISNKNWPDEDLGTFTNPYSLEVFRSINSADLMISQPTPANIYYQAGEKINLQPGFKAESGTHLLATIQPLDYCANPPTEIPQGFYQYPPVSKYNGQKPTSYQELNMMNEASSISSNSIQGDIKVFPNPSGGVFFIDNAIGYDRYEIRNTFGAIVSSDGINNSNFKIDLSGFEAGFYYIVFISDVNYSAKKILLE